MIATPRRGDGAEIYEEGAPRLQPQSPLVLTPPPAQGSVCADIAVRHHNQDPHPAKIKRIRKALLVGAAVLASTERDDPNADKAMRAEAAQAGRILSQLRRFLEYSGLKYFPKDKQEALVQIVITKYIVIEAVKPRWTFGAEKWAAKYAPEFCKSCSASWFREQAVRCRQEGRSYSPAEIGNVLGVTREAFIKAQLWDIWPAGCTAQERERMRLDRKAERERLNYRVRNPKAVPREQSLSRTRPWEHLSISRRTWETRRKAGRL